LYSLNKSVAQALRLPALFALLLALSAAAAYANPFFGAEEGAPAAPEYLVRRTAPGAFVGLQSRFRDSLAEAFNQAGSEGAAAFAVLGIAFLYGLAHAAGPGHRKTVVFSLFLGSKAKAWEPLAAGFLSALTHTLSGGLVILVLTLLRGAIASLASAEAVLAWMDGGSLLVLAFIALILIMNKLRHMNHAHEHGGARKGRGKYGIIFFTSLVPCTGSIMVLLFSLYMGSPLLGVAALLFIALGQGLVVSLAAYLAWFGREGLFLKLKERERTVAMVSGYLEIASYALILGFSIYMVWPFLLSLA
jgi:nickel/cobalt transporter (NicO) family protein